jgi:hypothetical protein
MPVGGIGARLWHHAFDLLHLVGFGALLGLVPAALLGATGTRGARAKLGWAAITLLAALGMHWLLREHLDREAQVLWDGRAHGVLFPLYVTLCAVAVPVAHILGAALGRVPGWRVVPLLAGLSAGATHHAILRDDYPGVHAAVEWASIALLAGVVGPALTRRWLGAPGVVADPKPTALAPAPRGDPLRLCRGARRRRIVAAAVGLLAVAPWVLAPRNATRLELFRAPGAVGAYVLSRLAWQSPCALVSAPMAASVYVPPLPRPPLEALAPVRRRGPVVVLLTVEALRADVLASRRYDASLPNLARLRDEGAYFPRTVAGGSQTSLNLTTLFSGRYFSQLSWAPYGQGAQRFIYAAADPIERFPARLTAAGVPTESFLGIVLLGADFGIARGFAKEHRIVTDRRHAVAQEVVGPLLRTLGRPGRRGLFAYAHVTEPHEPYDRGKVREGPDFDRYVSEVAVVDEWVGRLMKTLQSRARGRGYLILSGDHGEAFGEHGTRFHTKTLYEELVRVPLIVWGAGVPAAEHDEAAGLIDIGATVLELFGLPAPPWQMGQSLWPLILDEGPAPTRPLFAEGRLRRAYFAPDGLKVIDDRWRKTVEAYDLNADPGELRNLYDTEPERVAPHLATLRAFFERYERRVAGYRPPYKR